MNWTETLTPIGSLFALIVVIGVIVTAIVYSRSVAKTSKDKAIKDTKDEAMSDMQKSLTLVRDQNVDQAKEMVSLGKRVVELSGVVDTLKNIPLAKIEKHMADSTRHMENTNRLIEMLIPLIPKSVSVDTITKTVTTNN